MQTQTDDTDLFSVGELHTLEDARLAEEAEADQARRRSEERARRESEERVWREAEATRQADVERRKRESEARERARREALLREIQMEARLEEEADRLLQAARAEAEARTDAELARARPVAKIATLALGALLVVGGLGAWLMQAGDAEVARSRAVLERSVEEERAAVLARQASERRRFDAELGKLKQRLAAAQTRTDRERLQRTMADASAAHERRLLVAKHDGGGVVAVGAPAAPGSLLDPPAGLLGF